MRRTSSERYPTKSARPTGDVAVANWAIIGIGLILVLLGQPLAGCALMLAFEVGVAVGRHRAFKERVDAILESARVR
jgi:hypothetical protein